MPNSVNFRLRVTFVKTSRAAMLSHLEIARAVERAVRRAGLPYAISQGFSPHMKIAFGAALPVGVGSKGEYFDVQLHSWVAEDKALAALQAASVENLMPYHCEYIGAHEQAASVAFPVSVYEAIFSHPLTELSLPETIQVVRKKKEKTLVVSDYVEEGPIQTINEDQTACVRFVLRARDTGSLRPDLVTAELVQANPGVVLQRTTRIEQRRIFSLL